VSAPDPAVPASVHHVVTASKRAAYRPKNRFAAFLMWPLWVVLDTHTGRPSTPKCMAWAIYAAFCASRPIPAFVCGLLLATAFGYTMFKDYIARSSLSATTADAVNLSLKHETTEANTHAISETIERKYTDDGVPKYSAPPVPGAMTAAGEPE
jgi:hypothetical protein